MIVLDLIVPKMAESFPNREEKQCGKGRKCRLPIFPP